MKTTIQISIELKEFLEKQAIKKNETYEEIIRRLIPTSFPLRAGVLNIGHRGGLTATPGSLTGRLSPSRPELPTTPCPACGGTDYYIPEENYVGIPQPICARCHPKPRGK